MAAICRAGLFGSGRLLLKNYQRRCEVTFAEIYRNRYKNDIDYYGYWCPSIMFAVDVAPNFDEKTEIFDNGNLIGCRGITCEQCWNQECTALSE
jgi:hypothetical protein